MQNPHELHSFSVLVFWKSIVRNTSLLLWMIYSVSGDYAVWLLALCSWIQLVFVMGEIYTFVTHCTIVTGGFHLTASLATPTTRNEQYYWYSVNYTSEISMHSSTTWSKFIFGLESPFKHVVVGFLSAASLSICHSQSSGLQEQKTGKWWPFTNRST